MDPVKGFYGDAEVGQIQNLPEGTKAVVVRKLSEGMATAVVLHKNTIKRHLLFERDGGAHLGPVDVEFELRSPWIETYPDQIAKITQACWSAAMALPAHSVVHRWGPDVSWGQNREERVSPFTAALESASSESPFTPSTVKVLAGWLGFFLFVGAGIGAVRAGAMQAGAIAFIGAALIGLTLVLVTFCQVED